MPLAMETYEFIPLEDGGTSVRWRIRLQDRGPEATSWIEATAPILRQAFPMEPFLLMPVVKQDAAALAFDELGDPQGSA